MENFGVFRIDGHTLRVFLAVCETGSISRTAELFNLNQSTISHTIDKLRTAIGDPLFVKSGRGITPTEKALALIPQVQKILAGIEGLMAADQYDPRQDTRALRVAIPTPALMPKMKAVLNLLHDAAPGLRLEVLRLAPRERLNEMLTLEEIDVAIALNIARFPVTLNAMRFGQDRLVIYYDPDQRGPILSVDDYVTAQHVVTGFGGSRKSVVAAALEAHGLQRTISAAAPTASTLRDFVKGTQLIATMPLALSTGSYAGLAYCDPPLPMPDLVYDLVWHRRFEHSARNVWFRNLLLSCA